MSVGRIKAAHPTGDMILIELLTVQELSETKINLADGDRPEGKQAIILELGPKTPTDLGFAVGDRVVVTGRYVPLPKVESASLRPQGLIAPAGINAVLETSSILAVN